MRNVVCGVSHPPYRADADVIRTMQVRNKYSPESFLELLHISAHLQLPVIHQDKLRL